MVGWPTVPISVTVQVTVYKGGEYEGGVKNVGLLIGEERVAGAEDTHEYVVISTAIFWYRR